MNDWTLGDIALALILTIMVAMVSAAVYWLADVARKELRKRKRR